MADLYLPCNRSSNCDNMKRKDVAALLLKEDIRDKGDDTGLLGELMIPSRNAGFPGELS